MDKDKSARSNRLPTANKNLNRLILKYYFKKDKNEKNQ
jgi:hypothetical protein